jgi:hypothetical protein
MRRYLRANKKDRRGRQFSRCGGRSRRETAMCAGERHGNIDAALAGGCADADLSHAQGGLLQPISTRVALHVLARREMLRDARVATQPIPGRLRPARVSYFRHSGVGHARSYGALHEGHDPTNTNGL